MLCSPRLLKLISGSTSSDTGYRRSAGSDEVCPIFEGEHHSRDAILTGGVRSLTFTKTHHCRAWNEVWAVRPVVDPDLARRDTGIHLMGWTAGEWRWPEIARRRGEPCANHIANRTQLSHEQTVSTFHGSPTDAVQIHLDVQSRNSIGTSTVHTCAPPIRDRERML